MTVVVAVPCYNTARSIADVVTKASQHADHVIVIDDGSSDDTAQAARAMGALVVNHASNRGYGEAIKSCFRAAKAHDPTALVILDGDRQHNPDEIPHIISPILKGEADLVIGSRFLGHDHNMPRYRRVGIRTINFLWNFGSKTRVTDTQSGFRAYGRKALRDLSLTERGMSISIEILEKARRKGDIIKEVPISCFYVPSTLNSRAIRHGLSVALSVVRIRLKDSLPRRLKGGV